MKHAITKIIRTLSFVFILIQLFQAPAASAQTDMWTFSYRTNYAGVLGPVIDYGPYTTQLEGCEAQWQIMHNESIANGYPYAWMFRRPIYVAVGGPGPVCYDTQWDELSKTWVIKGDAGEVGPVSAPPVLTGTPGIEAYTYNKTGDRLSKTSSGLATGAYGYQTGTHWLKTIGTSARTYDANGNTTGSAVGGDTFGFGYNGRNRMTVVQRNGATVGTYVYNALGQRIAKTATLPQAVSERFAYDEGSQLIGEYGTVNRDYIWMADLPVAVVDTSGTTSTFNYVHADGLGTPRAISNASGVTQWQWSYQDNPFGEQPPASSTGYIFNLRFPGQYFDAESGISDNINRDYDAATGRYVQSDPIGLMGGISTYAYVSGSPLVYIDPLGLATLQIGFSFSYNFKIPFTAIGASGTAGIGAAFDTTGQIAPYGYYGGGGAAGTFGAAGGVHMAASNADTIADLAGPFTNVSIDGGGGEGGSIDGFWGPNADGCKIVRGGGFTVGGGEGAFIFSGKTTTFLGPAGKLW